MSRSLRVALVGPDQQENLPLGYVGAAAQSAGHQVALIAFCDRTEVGSAVRSILALAPDLVGVALPFQHTISAGLELVAELRAQGYGGHITCGGHVPTFCHEELLRDAAGLDSAIVHEGEATLVELCGRLADDGALTGVAGLVWRDGERIVVESARPALRDLDTLPHPLRRLPPYTVGGVAVGFIISARGCAGDCAYCSIHAFASAGGGPPLRLRSPAAVADEIAALRRDHNIAVVFVQDDLFILPSEKKTVARMDALAEELERRDATGLAFWIKGRPESITPAVLESAGRLGAIHIFLGVESASQPRLAYLGRKHRPEHNHQAIAACRAHSITPSFNFMLFDPDCRLEEVVETLDLAEANLDLPWNVCRTEIYSGTELRQRLADQGRLRGDYRSYGYLMADTRAEIMFRILRVSLHERALAYDSLLNRLISLAFSRQVHQHAFAGPLTEALSAEVDEVGVAARRDTVEAMRAAADFAAQVDPGDSEAVRRFALDQALALGARDLPWRSRSERLWQQLEIRGQALSQRAGALRLAAPLSEPLRPLPA